MGKYDKWLLLGAVLLVGFGSLMIYSCTSVVTPILAKKGITEFYYFKRHIFTIFIGFSFMFLAYKLKPSFIKKIALPLLVFSFVLLVLVFLPSIGVSAGGAKRWIRLWPSTFQPSEFVKLSMVIFLAKYMSMPEYRTDSFISFIKPVLIMLVFQVAILKQPDFGAAMSLAFLTFAMLFLSGSKIRYIASLSVFAIPVIIKLLMEPYRLRRLTSFLDPWEDARGGGFQLVQSFIALGSGGITGIGLGSSKQKLSYLPESHTDFIFSIIGEEFGFIGLSVVIALFVFLFIRGISIANRAKDEFVYYLAIGLSLMISLQALVNFAVATGLMPTKGLPLPFISYGGSALLVNMIAIGTLLSISRGEQISPALYDKETVKRKRARRNVYFNKKNQS
ncbi:MAG: cell division protein FtsW [Nitrospirae bacterium RBG_13_39_12]|nr:MAG: cell division protein FtsW [Nitrospirae bacterium RBG_13_39_12]